ncbi:MAG: phosphate acyltransferase PlsX [Deltaproteobacteria bacterium]|nr:phosphate acyltransferase PlsX [Deltaproteobacteria bacterium]
MRIAVDAMGGDRAPEVVVQGALEASHRFGTDIILVGHRRAIGNALDCYGSDKRLTVHHCEEMVLMEESPLKGVRSKKDSSIRVAFDLVKRGEADAVVSAGNSGATMAAALLVLGRVKGVDRPAFTSIMPGENGDVILLDVGANVDCKPEQLFQFGLMADAFASACLGMEKPRIGLLSIGEEGSKGNEQVRLAHELFKSSELNFAGNVEGRDIFSGTVQIVVCDGFVGNVALKLSEGMAEALTKMVKKDLLSTISGKAGLFLARKGFRKLKQKLDYAEYGGAPILGVKGVGIVCHGGSSSKAIKNAIKMAESYVNHHFLEGLSQHMARFQKEPIKGMMNS